jgi:threonine dehydrogenase-like Zn-dependent dehydrogenase
MRDEPVPQIGPDDILIKVAKTGICGTDLHIWKWDAWAEKTIPVPMVVGHEFAGIVTEIGSHVRTVQVGDRVSGEGHLIGMKSRMARAGHFHLDPETKGIGVNLPGAFAEYLKIPAFNAIHLPPEVDDEIGAILDPLGQRRAHRALLRPRGRGRADHRGRPHRHHGRRRLPPCGRAPCGGDGHQRLSPRPLQPGYRRRDGQRLAAKTCAT